MKTRLFAFAALGIALTACTNDNEMTDNGPVAAVINAEISDAVATRASGTTWADKDEIGVSENRYGYTNVRYRRANGKFEPGRGASSSSRIMPRPPSLPTIPTTAMAAH